MHTDMLQYEKNLLQQGIKLIAGVDEVGRGPLAGPMVVSAVILDLEKILNLFEASFARKNSQNNDVQSPENEKADHYSKREASGLSDADASFVHHVSKINDSKVVTPRMRSILNEFIQKEAISYSVVPVSHKKIDEWGISKCTQVGFFESIKNLHVKPDHVLTDHFEIKALTREHQTNIVRGDKLSISVAAASILAKVYRDRVMIDMHERWPVYGFDRHKGYGTRLHKEMIEKHGMCEIHRRSFRV